MLIHLINLDRSSERLARFRQVNSHLTAVSRFPAVDGRGLDMDELTRTDVVTSGLNYTPNTIGCALSHIALWRKAVEERTWLTICEDDAIFSSSYEHHAARLLENVGDWDFILWSGSMRCYTWLDVLPGGIGARLQFLEGPLFDNVLAFQEAPTQPALLPARYLLGLHCYSLSLRGARALLDHCLPLRPGVTDFAGFGLRLENTGIDCVMNGVLPSLNTYVCLPPLVIDDLRVDSVRTSP